MQADIFKKILKEMLPISFQRRIWALFRLRPIIGRVRFGSMRRLKPISKTYGFDRGQPVDRYFIEKFLASQAVHIRGHVLEIGNNTYTKMFGRDRVTQSDILHICEDNPRATIIADLTTADHIPSNMFDCIILTQTLQFIFDVKSALNTLHRILKPNGALLISIPGISQIDHIWPTYWSFTSFSAQQLFQETGTSWKEIQIETHGNVLAAIAFLHGLAAEELLTSELLYRDPFYQLVITIRAIKS